MPEVSEEEYLRTDYEPECELVDGVLLPKAAPGRLHSKLQYLLLTELASQEAKLGLEVYP